MQLGGSWLSWWMVAAAAVSQIGQFEAEMSSDSFQLLGMAERGFLPSILAKRSRYDTPTLGIILSSLGILTLSIFDFTQVSCPVRYRSELCEPLRNTRLEQIFKA